MGIDRILASSERDFAERSVAHIAGCILRFQKSRHGNFLLGLAGTNGHVRRDRAKDVFRTLGKVEEIDWSRVRVFLVDERYGFELDEDCNASMVRGSLLRALEERGTSVREDFLVAPDTSLPSWETCAADYEARLTALFETEGGQGPHLVTLGLATDMSVASVFPEWYRHSPERWAQATEKRFAVLCTETSTFEVPKRICVNLRVIRAAETVVLHLGSGTEEAWTSIKQEFDHVRGGKPATTAHKPLNRGRSSSTLHAVASAIKFQNRALKVAAGEAQGGATRSASLKVQSEDLPMERQVSHQSADFDPPSRTDRTTMRERLTIRSRTWDGGEDAEGQPVPISPMSPSFAMSALPESPLAYILAHTYVCVVQLRKDTDNHVALVVLGAGGDLARKKTFPAIFQLHLARVLPTNISIIACDDPSYHKDLTSTENLWQKRLVKHLEAEGRSSDLDDFKEKLEFVPTVWSDEAMLRSLDERIRELAKGMRDNRVFYLALPPFLFESAVRHIRQDCWSEPEGYCRVIVEKPFGRDLRTAQDLSMKLAAYLEESQIYRIDHYLAKTMVLNILTLRFANREMGRLFHADNVANVRITFKEDIGVEGRAGYFDNYGIIRDVMQNHILQLLTLVTMEAPASLQPEDVRDEKVKVLKQIRPAHPDDTVVGQYEGYQDDPDIQKVNEKTGRRSTCPTFATTVLYLDNERWSGVPLILKAGKNLETRSTIVRLQFKKAPPSSLFGDQPQNELVMRIQPNEAIYYRILAKTPGLSAKAHEVRRTVLDLDLRQLDVGRPPEAYEKLIHDVIQGEGHNFVRRDEVEEGWRIFDPLLRYLEDEDHGPSPLPYKPGSRGPPEADALINEMGFRRYTRTGVAGFAEDDFR
mmetsp:Transcript_77883/g.167052  ORF Transcript_77883/g.167052 Transcript_77883/m.167052 type:complete len:873 (+) Transcript_77883:106-2724(+)